MNKSSIFHILENLQTGTIDIDEAFVRLKDLPFTDIGHTKIDNHRALRNGYPE